MAKRFIDGGTLGEIYAARVKVTRRRGIPSWGVFTNKELQGGSALMDLQKIGNRPGVSPWGPWDWKHYEVEDLALGMVRLASGATVMVEASFADNIEKDETTVQLSGTEGGLQPLPLKVVREEYGAVTDTTPHWVPQQDMYQEELRHFVACCVEKRSPGSRWTRRSSSSRSSTAFRRGGSGAQLGPQLTPGSGL